MNLTALFLIFAVYHFVQRILEIKLHQREKGNVKERQSFQWMAFFHLVYYFGSILECVLIRSPLHVGVSILGLILFFLGFVLRKWAIQTLGRFWSVRVEVRKDQPLIKRGPYRYCRHPNYLAIALEVVGFCLVANAYLTLLVSAVGYGVVLFRRIQLEELVLIKKYANRYRIYIKKTDALIPGPKLFKRLLKLSDND